MDKNLHNAIKRKQKNIPVHSLGFKKKEGITRIYQYMKM